MENLWLLIIFANFAICYIDSGYFNLVSLDKIKYYTSWLKQSIFSLPVA